MNPSQNKEVLRENSLLKLLLLFRRTLSAKIKCFVNTGPDLFVCLFLLETALFHISALFIDFSSFTVYVSCVYNCSS